MKNESLIRQFGGQDHTYLPKTFIEYDSSSKTGRLSLVSVIETVIVAVDDLLDVPVSCAITLKRDFHFKIIFFVLLRYVTLLTKTINFL